MTEEEAYQGVQIGDHGVCCICNFIFTVDVVAEMNPCGYVDRWSYPTKATALKALVDWALSPDTPSPEGWLVDRRIQELEGQVETLNTRLMLSEMSYEEID